MSNHLIKKPAEPATEVITHDVTPLTVNTDSGAYAKVGWIVVLAGVLGFLLWATFAPLDKGVPLSGFVTKEGNRKAIQYPTIGTVQDILVRDGDVVKAGQVLVRMNDTQVSSALEATLAQYIVDRAAEARLMAELGGSSNVLLPKDLMSYQADPRVKESMDLQRQLLSSRRLALENELQAMSETASGLISQIHGLEESRESKKVQLAYIKEQLDNNRDLVKEGFVPRSHLLELERSYAQISGTISEDTGNLARYRSQVNEANLHRAQRQQEYQKEVRSQLSEVHKEAESLAGRLQGQRYDVANVELKSPVDGVVVGSTVFTKGGVVSPGSKLMEIVPTDDVLVVEGQLAVNLVDKVHPGLPAELIFSAFNTNRTPHIPGEVIQVAADRTVDERNGQPYYKVRARVTPAGAKLIAEHKLAVVPGMPVELFVKTGERTMMNYLMKPIFDRAKTSMSED
ncbi:HlyD family type I secretion periplasmic adaptor subunit [Duganella sp. FT135W]|uniref:Membrane fusion protein (MFP) family protein n=1 Tax=Duganella flavida TaxID=2692175 RepID=A0A6L8K814_9BURK|nr:HlyD family type I secretion periplasmic adaptor subunit [Duganella flavida]MYM23165.1 HlyD family type I secretion periplasmic adaptor subunit [Duganella flavida]